VLIKECIELRYELATSSSQFFRKTFKKSLKIRITLQMVMAMNYKMSHAQAAQGAYIVMAARG
jgi:hypothetical protein